MRTTFKPSFAWGASLGLFFGIAFAYVLVAENRISEFIYFIF